jgi:hypothetical protein
MSKYHVGDIECSVISDFAGRFRAHVRVAGHRLQLLQIEDYVHVSIEVFDDESCALRHAMNHANKNFPPE